MAEEQARSLQAKERVATDRMISQWVSKAAPGSPMPSELTERLTPNEQQQIESTVSGATGTKTDPTVLAEIVNGLKSRSPETQRQWAQVPLYRYRPHLSASDFAKVVELQQDLDPVAGYSLSELAAIRKQLAARPDTSDLDWAYRALRADPDVYYAEYLPIGGNRRTGEVRVPVLPEAGRRFLKGLLDLLKGTKDGEVTSDAVGTFTALTGGAGHTFGPRGGAGTLASGGKRPLVESTVPSKSGYPPGDGFMGPKVKETLKIGARVDRYGGTGGRYLAPEGTPFTRRAMPSDHEQRPRYVYEVMKPFEVEGGVSYPAFGQSGFGWQYFLGGRTVQDLIDSGFLREVK
jgi:hypothetical protein